MAGKTQYKNTWQKENVDRVNLTMPKGRKAIIQAHAAAAGESLNGFIGRAITETMERDRSEGLQEATGTPTEAGGISLPSDTIEAAQKAAEAAGEAVPVFIDRAVTTQAQRDEMDRKMKGGKSQ